MFQPIVAEITMDNHMRNYKDDYQTHVNSRHMAFRVFDNKLINKVAKIPVIYNNRLKEFRNSTAKENVWRLT